MEGRHREVVALRVREMNRDDLIKAYNRERDKAVMGSLDEFIAFADKHQKFFSNRLSAEIAQHKMRTAIESLPEEVRTASMEWLTKRGYTSWHGGN